MADAEQVVDGQTKGLSDNQTPVTGISLTQIWQSDSTLITPESVLFDDTNGLYYVSVLVTFLLIKKTETAT